ncbi:hypothetical protein [Terracoccus luteus]|uniref:Uncharacterized protein n=1 Tax=Terracoccus luteus TaxID=53356 RepID=A0A839PT01_9MICO|nr:hypothetical protein [Terracoccus luteus]MBB2985894.1 hypothetical protein [Terracoccus luteus]MCP2171546.1 hypothetical protein [Terracoccus luteus]
MSWSGSGASATLTVRDGCRCEDDTLARWHGLLRQDAAGHPLEARFTLSSLAPVAWWDVAARLAANGLVTVVPTRRRRDPRCGVVDAGPVRRARPHLLDAARAETLEDVTHDRLEAAAGFGRFPVVSP